MLPTTGVSDNATANNNEHPQNVLKEIHYQVI